MRYDERKTAKIDFPSRGKTRNQRKSTFPHGGKQEISENRLSLTGENQKTAKNSFPSRGKTRSQRKSAFPREGKSKNREKQISLTGEIGKTPKVRQNFRSYVHFDTPLLFIL